MSKELIEGVREIIRTAVLAVIPLVIAQLQNGQIDYKAVGVAAAIALLSGLDKWLHKADKQPYNAVGLDHAGLIPV